MIGIHRPGAEYYNTKNTLMENRISVSANGNSSPTEWRYDCDWPSNPFKVGNRLLRCAPSFCPIHNDDVDLSLSLNPSFLQHRDTCISTNVLDTYSTFPIFYTHHFLKLNSQYARSCWPSRPERRGDGYEHTQGVPEL